MCAVLGGFPALVGLGFTHTNSERLDTNKLPLRTHGREAVGSYQSQSALIFSTFIWLVGWLVGWLVLLRMESVGLGVESFV